MKINISNTNYTIGFSIYYACLLLAFFIINMFRISLPQPVLYFLSISVSFCFVWLIVFMISLLKTLREKPFITAAFIVLLISAVVDTVVSFLIPLMRERLGDYLETYFTINAAVVGVILIYLTTATFMIRHRQVKTPLLFFVLSKLFIMIVYIAVPRLLSNVMDGNYYKYMQLLYLLIPIAGVYLAVTMLNLLNSDDSFQPVIRRNFGPENPGSIGSDWGNESPNL